MNSAPRTRAPGWPYYVELTLDAARRVGQCLWVRILYLSGALWWAKRELNRQGAIVVLTLHRVLDDASFSKTDSLANIVVRKSSFGKLARYVTGKYEVLDVQKALPGPSSGRLRVAFTFDDGWQDNFENALPVLKQYGIPATIFLCTGLMDRTAPFWPEQVRGTLYSSLCASYGKRADRLVEALIEGLKYGSAEARQSHLDLLLQQTNGQPTKFFDSDATLSWQQIGAMRSEGVAFGSHGHTHQIMTSVALDLAKAEACDSKTAIESALKDPCRTFAYPNGNWSPEIRDLLSEGGYRLAFTTDRGAWMPGTDKLAIPRSNVQEEDLTGLSGRFSAAMFDYATFWKVWQNLRREQKLQAVRSPLVPAEAAAQELR
jgi:peptidoglycan/xylan/chitin deacetylase (PgdA/CDA1 family)